MFFPEQLWDDGRAFLLDHDLVFSDSQWAMLKGDLSKFVDLFYVQNANLNLTSIKDPNEVFWKHLIDSLLVLRFSRLEGLVDWGTGGGFPGIPVSLALRALETKGAKGLLLDSVRKKIAAVEGFLEELKLSNVSALWGRGEVLVPKLSWAVTSILMRAVAPPERAVPWVASVGGRWILLLSPNQVSEWKERLTRNRSGRLELFDEVEISLPEKMGERSLVELRFVPRGTN